MSTQRLLMSHLFNHLIRMAQMVKPFRKWRVEVRTEREKHEIPCVLILLKFMASSLPKHLLLAAVQHMSPSQRPILTTPDRIS